MKIHHKGYKVLTTVHGLRVTGKGNLWNFCKEWLIVPFSSSLSDKILGKLFYFFGWM
jgi:hypothetical protein